MPFTAKLVKFVAAYPEPCMVTAATTLFSVACIALGVAEFKNFDPNASIDPE